MMCAEQETEHGACVLSSTKMQILSIIITVAYLTHDPFLPAHSPQR